MEIIFTKLVIQKKSVVYPWLSAEMLRPYEIEADDKKYQIFKQTNLGIKQY